MVGRTIGHYRIEAQLGTGGMGVVYRARDLRLNRSVALKVLGTAPAGSPTTHELLHEGRAASALNHPNVCTVHEVGEDHGQLFMVMELVEGSPLSAMIPSAGLPIDQVLQYGIQVADGLEHAHERGVVHGDLKTANVMVTPEGRAKVLDFGLARRRPDAPRDQTTRVIDADANATLAGTLAYMSPEMLRGQPAGTASDIWALGVMLYEISTGKLPFHGTTTFDLTASILRETATLPTHVPPALRTIILRCLAKEPGQRYRRAGEIHAALEAVDSSTRVTRDDVAPRPRRPRVLWIAAAALVVAAAVGTTVWQQLTTPSWPTAGRWVRLATGGGRAFDPSLSQDGKMVAYVAETGDGHLDLFVARVAGGSPIALTTDAAIEAYPRFSADGERIVFTRRPAGSMTFDVCVIPTLGGEIRTLVQNATTPVWSPSGTRIAFIRREARDNIMELATSAADGSDMHALLRGDGTFPFLRSPAWSPDGRQIAVVRGRGGIAAEIWTVPAGGGPPVKIAAEGTSVFSDDPVFTPDGRAIIYSSNRGGATNLWAVLLRGGSPVRLTNGPGPDESPTIARDGTIALVNTRWRHVLFVQDLQTGVARPLHAETPFIWAPVWSPDASELAFSRGDADGTWHIWVVSATGGAPRQLTTGALGEVYPRYLPDGTALLYHTWEMPHRIWRVPHGGGPAVAVTDGPNDQFADVSPDGKWLAFVRSEQNAERIYVAPLAGGAPRLLTSSSGSVPRWSPDGKMIAFSRDRGYAGGVVIIGADGQGQRTLTEKGGWPVWWPDGKHVGYRIIGVDANQQILVAPVDGGPSVALDSVKFSGTNEPFDLWRDGRQLASSNVQHVSDEIWMIRQDRD